MEKINDDDKVMEEAKKEIDIQDLTPSPQSQPIQLVVISTLGEVTPFHFLIPRASQEEIKSIFFTQIVDPIDWETFVNKPPMLPKKQPKILSKVIEMGDIKIAQIPFKEG